jgi:hypothetical protein
MKKAERSTPEELRKNPALKHLNDEEAENIIDSLQSFSKLYQQQQVLKNRISKLKYEDEESGIAA